MARKWDEEKREYKPYELPKGATCYETDMDKIVNCARCGKKTMFGYGYTSKHIHTEMGFGYCVCGACYLKELDELMKFGDKK